MTAVGALLVHGAIAWIENPEIKNINSNGANIIAFGDSLVYGVGASDKGKTDLFSLVSKEIGVPIINVGVSGNTTEEALKRIDKDVLSKDPKIVFVLLGGNDYLQKKMKDDTFLNLRNIIKKIQDKGAIVILIGVRGGIFIDRFEEDYKNLAKEFNTGYVENILDGIVTNRSLMYDSIHPNDKGYEIISLRVIPVLREILEERNEL